MLFLPFAKNSQNFPWGLKVKVKVEVKVEVKFKFKLKVRVKVRVKVKVKVKDMPNFGPWLGMAFCFTIFLNQI